MREKQRPSRDESPVDHLIFAESRLELFAAAMMPETADPEKKICDMVLYSGATVDRMDYWTGERYKLTLSLNPEAVRLTRLNNGAAPLLDNHMSWSCRDQLGVMKKGWIEDGKLKATAQFSAREDVAPVWKDVQDGILRSVSLAAVVHRLQDITPDADKLKSYLAVDWEPFEGSIVPVPADPGAGFLSAQLGFISPNGTVIERPQVNNISILAAARRREIELLSFR